MNYKLAKKLKDAGFPQAGNGKWFHQDKEGSVYIPPLSELIEACGEGIHAISKFKNGHRSDGWYSMGTTWLSSVPMYFEAPTPEEAVANLYIELNKKDGK